MQEVYSSDSRKKIDNEFAWIRDNIYLDYAGAALYSSNQINDIFKELQTTLYANPHSSNEAGRLSSVAIDQLRSRILNFFNTNTDEYSIIFTAGATASIKLLLESFQWYQDSGENQSEKEWFDAVTGPGYYVYTASNHTSILGGRLLAKRRGAMLICVQDKTVEHLTKKSHQMNNVQCGSRSLFAYPAQCNFSGKKYPLEWLKSVKKGMLNELPLVENKTTSWYTLLDAATFCSTNELNLSMIKPDFVCLSFYKIFGYPTGLGALLVRNSSAHCLEKSYFGGGTVEMVLPSQSVQKPRETFHERFEDGTLPYLSILALTHGLDTLSRLGLTMSLISRHVFNLACYTKEVMSALRHWNGKHVVHLYSTVSSSVLNEGGIVAFNVLRANGDFVGYNEVLKVASSYKIQLRTGCFCNVGACQKFLGLSDEQLMQNFQAGHVCGDERDIINGKPTGAVRISFGYPSSLEDVHALLNMIRDNFLEFSDFSVFSPALPAKETECWLRSIRLYPVKSCGALKVDKWKLSRRGLMMDRNWVIVDSKGVSVTQKEEPLLCRVLPKLELESPTKLSLTFSGRDQIEIPFIDTTELNTVQSHHKLCGDDVTLVNCGPSVAEWLSQHLNREGLRLMQQVYNNGRKSRVIRQGAESNSSSCDKLSLVNQAQYLFINSASVDFLRNRIMDQPNFNHETLEDRFRSNFIVDGPSAFVENDWTKFRIGKVEFKVDRPCTRCQMICIDQETGDKNRTPLVELSKALGGKLRFGIYCSHISDVEGVDISVGESLIFE